jgi:hypothetical protein
VGPRPYTHAASDFSATNSLAKALGEHHEESLHLVRPLEDGGGRSRAGHPAIRAG